MRITNDQFVDLLRAADSAEPAFRAASLALAAAVIGVPTPENSYQVDTRVLQEHALQQETPQALFIADILASFCSVHHGTALMRTSELGIEPARVQARAQSRDGWPVFASARQIAAFALANGIHLIIYKHSLRFLVKLACVFLQLEPFCSASSITSTKIQTRFFRTWIAPFTPYVLPYLVRLISIFCSLIYVLSASVDSFVAGSAKSSLRAQLWAALQAKKTGFASSALLDFAQQLIDIRQGARGSWPAFARRDFINRSCSRQQQQQY